MEVTTKITFSEFLMRVAKEIAYYLPDSDHLEVHIDSVPVLNGRGLQGQESWT